jgi:hypothetical protein
MLCVSGHGGFRSPRFDPLRPRVRVDLFAGESQISVPARRRRFRLPPGEVSMANIGSSVAPRVTML